MEKDDTWPLFSLKSIQQDTQRIKNRGAASAHAQKRSSSHNGRVQQSMKDSTTTGNTAEEAVMEKVTVFERQMRDEEDNESSVVSSRTSHGNAMNVSSRQRNIEFLALKSLYINVAMTSNATKRARLLTWAQVLQLQTLSTMVATAAAAPTADMGLDSSNGITRSSHKTTLLKDDDVYEEDRVKNLLENTFPQCLTMRLTTALTSTWEKESHYTRCIRDDVGQPPFSKDDHRSGWTYHTLQEAIQTTAVTTAAHPSSASDPSEDSQNVERQAYRKVLSQAIKRPPLVIPLRAFSLSSTSLSSSHGYCEEDEEEEENENDHNTSTSLTWLTSSLTPQEERQCDKDLQRDILLLNTLPVVSSATSSYYHTIVTAAVQEMQSLIAACPIITLQRLKGGNTDDTDDTDVRSIKSIRSIRSVDSHEVEKTETTPQDLFQAALTPPPPPHVWTSWLTTFAKRMCQLVNRTESGGSAYEVLDRLFMPGGPHHPSVGLLCPHSEGASPLALTLSLGPFPVASITSTSPLTPGWDYGLIGTMTATTAYHLVDANDPTKEWIAITATYQNSVTMSLTSCGFHQACVLCPCVPVTQVMGATITVTLTDLEEDEEDEEDVV